jgi:hypothetical protein
MTVPVPNLRSSGKKAIKKSEKAGSKRRRIAQIRKDRKSKEWRR